MWQGRCQSWDGSLSWGRLAAYARVAAGHSGVLLISGEAGIGKTRLVEALCERASSAAGGAQVRIGESAPLAGSRCPTGHSWPRCATRPTGCWPAAALAAATC